MDLTRDNNFLLQGYEKAAQIVDQANQLLEDPNTDPQSLEMSVIPTSILVDLASGYLDLYDTLVELTILSPGYRNKSTNNIH